MTDLTVRATRPDSSAALSKLRIPELQALAAELGLRGASKLRKGELVDAISEIQNSTTTPDAPTQDAPGAPAEGAVAAETVAAPAVVKKRAPRRASTSIVDAGATDAPIIAAPSFEPETVAEVVKTAPKSVSRHVNRAESGVDLIPGQEAEREAQADVAQPTEGDVAQPTRNSRNRNRNRGDRQQNDANRGSEQNNAEQNATAPNDDVVRTNSRNVTGRNAGDWSHHSVFDIADHRTAGIKICNQEHVRPAFSIRTIHCELLEGDGGAPVSIGSGCLRDGHDANSRRDDRRSLFNGHGARKDFCG